MHSLRTLPLLRPSSRSQSQAPPDSRTASPAPPSTSTVSANGLSTLNPAYAAPHMEERMSRLGERSVSAGGHPRSKSLTRPLAGLAGLALGGSGAPAGNNIPAPNGSVTLTPSVSPNPGNAPLGKSTSIGNISPPGSRPSTPLPAVNGTPSESPTIDAIGLRLNEQVNRVCLGVDSKTLRGFKKGAGWGLGEAVVRDIPPPQSDAYLLRAVLRTSVRSLVIYGSRLEYFLLPAVAHADFSHPVNIHPTPATAPLLNPVQMYALSVCHAAWETCEVLEVALETTAYPRFVGEALRPVMDKLDSVVARVVMPLMASIKKELLIALTGSGDAPSPPSGHKHLPNGSILPPTLPAKAASHIPHGMRTFASRVDSARKAFELICKDCREDGETWVASVVVAIIWKGLCTCIAKYNPDEKAAAVNGTGRPPSPEAIGRALASLAKDGVGHQPAPPSGVTAVSKMAVSILPSRTVSRPASPPRPKAHELPHDKHVGVATIPPSAVALASFEALVTRLVTGLVQKPAPVAPAADDPTASEHLAREALDEALEAITSMRIVIASFERGSAYMVSVNKHLKDDIEMPDPRDEKVVDAVEDVPAVLLFQLLGKKVNFALQPTGVQLRSCSKIWGISEEDYDRQFLSAFSVAEERARRVALAYKGELERVGKELLVYQAKTGADVKDVKGWVQAFSLAIQARSGIVPALPGY